MRTKTRIGTKRRFDMAKNLDPLSRALLEDDWSPFYFKGFIALLLSDSGPEPIAFTAVMENE